MQNIIDLRETAPNQWHAKYRGNYGIYSIRIHTDGRQRGRFSCTCPSDYSPCKHIAIIEKAIALRIAKNSESKKGGVAELLGKLSREELHDFLLKMTRNNPDLANAVFLAFADKIEDGDGGKGYARIIRKGLEDMAFDEDCACDDEAGFEIPILDQWAEKARQSLREKKPREAILIAQAYIEAFSHWLHDSADDSIHDYIIDKYYAQSFAILKTAAKAPEIARELFDHYMAEAKKKNRFDSYMAHHLHEFLLDLCTEEVLASFVEFQQRLLDKVEDRRSYKAEEILQRIVKACNNCHQPKKAWQYVEENLQIDHFRKMIIEKRIAQGQFPEARQLIRERLNDEQSKFDSKLWKNYLLQLAQAEQDMPAMRRISLDFLQENFDSEHYKVYRSTFHADEWEAAFTALLQYYETNKSAWYDPAADLLVAEGKAERLLAHIENRLSLERLEKYHVFFAGDFPEQTLALFCKALNPYAENNLGRSHYEHIAQIFQQMEKIPGGGTVVAKLKTQFLLHYRNRRAMVEILNREKPGSA